MQRTNISINLESLLSLSDKLNNTTDTKEILNLALLSLIGKFKITRAAVYIPSANGNFELQQYKGNVPDREISKDLVNKLFDLSPNAINEEINYFYCIPVKYRDKLFAIITLGQKFDKTDLTDDEVYYSKIVTTITAQALNSSANFQLLKREKVLTERKNQLLSTLLEVSKDFNVFLSKDKIIKTLALNLQGQLMINKFAFVYYDEDFKNFDILFNTLGDFPGENLLFELFNIEETSLKYNLKLKNDFNDWLKFKKVKVISPMTIQGKSKGFLLIGEKITREDFTSENLLFIKVIGNTAILTIENLKLIEKEFEKKQLEKELSLALEIQKGLLPKRMPQISSYDIDAFTEPTRFVGGDYFDIIKLEEDKYLLAIADVSGKGMPASLLMANVQAALRSLTELKIELSTLVNMINRLIYQNTSADKFVTAFFGILDSKNHIFEYINAGHNPPILFYKNDLKLLSKGGLILGVLGEELNYESERIDLNVGALILLYTDGITEAMNNSGEEFGEDRLRQIIKNNNHNSISGLMKSIKNEVLNFTGNILQDDITIFGLKRLY